MDLLAVSPESEYSDEVNLIGRLFESGLTRYHLRKPDWSFEQCSRFLEAIPSDFHSRISLHQHHALAARFGTGVHFKEADLSGDWMRDLATCLPKQDKASEFFVCSGSFHSLRDIASRGFDYVFLSPIFPSISKRNHIPKWSMDELSSALKAPSEARIYALGGMTSTNFIQAIQLGFDGVVLHGALWQAAEPLRILEAVLKEAVQI